MGAPLIPKFHQYLFGSENIKKIVFNIGGIANGTYLDNKKIMLASDVGPGNCLMDLVAKKKLDSNFDLKGETASKGKIIEYRKRSGYKQPATIAMQRGNITNGIIKVEDGCMPNYNRTAWGPSLITPGLGEIFALTTMSIEPTVFQTTLRHPNMINTARASAKKIKHDQRNANGSQNNQE